VPSAAQAPEAANPAEGGADATATKAGETDTADAGAGSGPAEGGIGGNLVTPEGPPAALSAEALPTPAPEGARNAAASEAEEAPSPEPLAFDAGDESGDGLSTLRLLEIVAAVAFLASGLYVFIWPRISRGGS
jgi:hypothetical protein